MRGEYVNDRHAATLTTRNRHVGRNSYAVAPPRQPIYASGFLSKTATLTPRLLVATASVAPRPTMSPRPTMTAPLPMKSMRAVCFGQKRPVLVRCGCRRTLARPVPASDAGKCWRRFLLNGGRRRPSHREPERWRESCCRRSCADASHLAHVVAMGDTRQSATLGIAPQPARTSMQRPT